MDTPTELRQLIIHHYESGVHTQQQIANIVQCPRSTVGDIIRHFNQQGTTNTLRKGKCGRKKSLNVRVERAICRTSKTNPQMTARQIKEEVGGCAANVSTDTIKRTLRRHGRHTYRPSACPALNARQKATRLRWCQDHRFWSTDQWRKVSKTCTIYIIKCVMHCNYAFLIFYSGNLL
jgi:transposase